MVTKAKRAYEEQERERLVQKREKKPAADAQAARPARRAFQQKPHNRGARAGRNATVAYEGSRSNPSRKSTRRSKNRARAATPIERKVQLKQQQPDTSARIAQARAVRVRGKAPKAKAR
jgi:hypothetical protein